MPPLLEISNLVVGYNEVPVLRGVNLTADRGEVVAVIGPNGAGKSTLIKAAFGLLKPTKGTVLLDGQDITGWSPERVLTRGMSYVPQVSNVFPSLSVRENLEMGAYILNYGPSGIIGASTARLLDLLFSRALHRPRERFYPSAWMGRAEIDSRIDGVMELFPDLRKRLEERTGNLSGGQQQMLALGRALILKPKILLIDEPSAGLAPKLVDSVFRQIASINQAGTTIVLVEQNAKKALQLAHRGYVLETGQNRLVDRADRILDNPEIGAMFLGVPSALSSPKER